MIEPQISVGARYAPSPSPGGVGHGQGMYDKTPCDSEVEVRFADTLEHNACVKLYIKLPAAFKIATPIGNYNPDWAIVLDARDGHGDNAGATLYLVRETKSTTDPHTLANEERWKVICGARHFRAALGVDYRVVTDQSDLPDDGWTGNIPLAQP